MLNKPDKHGLKLFSLRDYLTKYILNEMPYIGRQGNQKNVGSSSDAIKFLSTPLHFSEVNLTTDNGFRSSQLSADLIQKQITLLETMKK